MVLPMPVPVQGGAVQQLGSTPPSTSTPLVPSSFTTAGTSSGTASGSKTTPNAIIQKRSSLSRSSGRLQTGELPRTETIKKADTFIKIEGFHPSDQDEDDDSQSRGESSIGKGGKSLLTRELSMENVHSASMNGVKNTKPEESGSWISAGWSASSPLSSWKRSVLPSLEPTPRKESPYNGLLPGSHSALSGLQEKYPVFKEPLVVRAFNISRLSHDGRYDDKPRRVATFEKCVSAASILADLGADEVAVSGALLFDALDRTMLSEKQLRPMIGSEGTMELVKEISHLSYMCQRFKTSNAFSSTWNAYDSAHDAVPECLDLVGLMLSHATPTSLLVILGVSLAEMRLCASSVMENGNLVRQDYVQTMAHEAMSVWAPLANRIGIWSMKAELEDLSFRCLLPTECVMLQQCLRGAQEPAALIGLVDRLRSALQDEDIDYIDLSGRPKHLWGVWSKMQKKGYSAERVKDVRGLRVIVNSREECYKALRAVETVWKIVGPSKNYIKEPKKNGYQSLHVIADPGDGHLVEVQIRTDKMHYLAEYGLHASHWKYKEESPVDENAQDLPEISREVNWAKYVAQKYVGVDKKCRPSGSPSEDKSLEHIIAGIKKTTLEAPDDLSPGNRKGKTFHEYIAETGQAVEPPQAPTILVAVVCEGSFYVQALERGSTIGDVLKSRLREVTMKSSMQVILNRKTGLATSTVLSAGDVLEFHAAPVLSEEVNVRDISGSAKGNMLPLGSLAQRLGTPRE